MAMEILGKSWHFAGAGGAGMSALAAIFAQRGCKVSGCDAYDSPRLRAAAREGVEVSTPHDPRHAELADVFVATPAIPCDSPELAAIRASGKPLMRRGEALAGFFNGERGVAVFGTHGKTTVSVFTARLLSALGAEPGWCVGGEADGLSPFAKAPGPGRPFVAEADESDGTLALYRPEISVFTAADLDHLEHFASLEEYYGCFAKVLAATRRAAAVCRDHETAVRIARESCGARIVTYGFHPEADVRAEDAGTDADGSRFTIAEGADSARVAIPVSGMHNIQNALAAFAAARAAGFSFADAARELPRACSSLPARRFELLGEGGGACVFADYAHHPAELARAVEMARLRKPRRLRVLFQPHRYTRTKALADEFPKAFEGVDELVILPVYAAFEKPVAGGTSADLYIKCRAAGLRAELARSREEAWRHAELTLEPGDLVLLAGAGDIIALAPAVKELFAGIAARGGIARGKLVPLAPYSFYGCGGATAGGVIDLEPGAEIPRGAEIAGAGSNRWFSGLATDRTYVRLPRGGEVRREGNTLVAPAGILGKAVLDAAEREGLSGLEFLEGVPGTVGGWIAMNAGAHGRCAADAVESVKALQNGGAEIILPSAGCGFGYRRCKAVEDGCTVLEARFALVPGDPEKIKALRAECRAARRVDPRGLRTAGCVFRNPPGDSAGRLMEAAGVKKMRAGGAYAWENHANVFAAGEGCTASDLLALALAARAAVEERFGVRLEFEVRGFEDRAKGKFGEDRRNGKQ